MVDVGGTLWPNSWPFRESDALGRRQRIADVMPGLTPEAADALATDLIQSSRPGDEKRSISTEMEIVVSAEELIAGSLARQGLAANADTVALLRRAMSIPVSDRMKPLPGALELLQEIHALGMKTVIASNTYWRDADSYWADFRILGLAEHIDAIVTSVDVGRLKPHPAVFEMAMRWAGVHPEQWRSSSTRMTPCRRRATHMQWLLTCGRVPKPCGLCSTRVETRGRAPRRSAGHCTGRKWRAD